MGKKTIRNVFLENFWALVSCELYTGRGYLLVGCHPKQWERERKNGEGEMEVHGCTCICSVFVCM